MPSSKPLDVQRKEFTRSVRGYAVAEVDTFLDDVVEELARLQKEIDRLNRRPSDSAGEEAIARALITAQRVADQTIEDARAKVRMMIGEAEADVRQTTDLAEQKAREVTETAEQHARKVTEEMAERRRRLERSIEALGAFERDYRARLHDYVQGQLDMLETASLPEPMGPPPIEMSEL
jgi:cell division initiation protein